MNDINPGAGIERLRLARNISKKELALETGIDEGNLNRIISGKQWPTKQRLKALAEFFGVPLFEIFRIAEEGAVYSAKENRDPRKAKLIAAIEELTSDQLDHAFRDRCDPQPQRDAEQETTRENATQSPSANGDSPHAPRRRA